MDDVASRRENSQGERIELRNLIKFLCKTATA